MNIQGEQLNMAVFFWFLGKRRPRLTSHSSLPYRLVYRTLVRGVGGLGGGSDHLHHRHGQVDPAEVHVHQTKET